MKIFLLLIALASTSSAFSSPVKEADCAPEVTKTATELGQDLAKTADKMGEDSIARGRELVKADGKGKCLECHTYGDDNAGFAFLPNEATQDATFKEGQTYLRQILAGSFKDSINESVVKEKRMPPGGNDLSDQDREDIRAYIESFSK